MAEFTQQIRKQGDSLVITIPSKEAMADGLGPGDFIKVSIVKRDVTDEQNA